MQLIDLVHQICNDSKIDNVIWVSFAHDLILLSKYYKNSDPDFILALEEFSSKIQKGFGVTQSVPKGYGLDKKWVIDLFITIFNPLLNKKFKEGSLAWVEFAFAKIELPLEEHLSSDNLYKVAESLKTIESAMEKHIFENKLIDKLLIQETAAIGLVASILYYLHNKLSKRDLQWCKCCFRRAKENSKYCSLHKPQSEGSNNNHKHSKKVYSEISKKFNLIDFNHESELYEKSIEYDPEYSEIMFEHDFRRLRVLRSIFELEVNLIFFEDINNTDISANIIYIKIQDELRKLTDLSLKNEWVDISSMWDKTIKISFPSTYKLILRNPSTFSTLDEFIFYVRNVLDEFTETCLHPFWFICELSMAEAWINFENHTNHQNLRNTKILSLSKANVSVNQICEEFGLKKSQVYEIIKKEKQLLE